MTKRELVLVIGMITSFVATAAISYSFGVEGQKREQEIIERHIENASKGNSIKFIWNDDEESIPAEGGLVKVEAIDENTVYLTPIN
jgi:hypothetical protein